MRRSVSGPQRRNPDSAGEPLLVPEKALLLGPCQVIPQEYPHISCQSIDVAAPLPAGPDASADERLKRRLIELSMGHDIVLDLHCDDESVPYLYVPRLLWPAMADCASALGVDGDASPARSIAPRRSSSSRRPASPSSPPPSRKPTPAAPGRSRP